jgi:ankyrin repeat protein
VALLLENNANIEATDKQQHTPIHSAVKYGRITVVKILQQKGASIINRDDKGLTVLHKAAGSGNLELVQVLLKGENGTQNECVDDDGRTCLFSALKYPTAKDLFVYT